MSWNFDNRYAQLPAQFYAFTNPTAVAAPKLIALNQRLAASLGLRDELADPAQAAQLLAGNLLPDGAQPLAMAYAGHQFGHFVPQLGDGRAILLGEIVDNAGLRRDIQLKGAGRTAFSRGGDGRAALGPVLREYLLCEAMYALRVPTTQALAAVSTGESVLRDRPLPGAIVVRVARSHIRVGTFQYFAARGDYDSVRQLVEHLLTDRLPELDRGESPALSLLNWVVNAQAALVAKWLQLGFVHGVMNTDNTSITAETIDYGPCAFLDHYDPNAVFSSIDHGGRYAYAQQPGIAHWNLCRLAECLLPLLDSDSEAAVATATQALNAFQIRFEAHWLAGMQAKLGLSEAHSEDSRLIQDLLDLMQQQKADFTRVFRCLSEALNDVAALQQEIADASGAAAWHQRWLDRLDRERRDHTQVKAELNASNPIYIPRNHLVEQALSDAVERADFARFERLFSACSEPYRAREDCSDLTQSPAPQERVYQTFCGT